MNASFFSLTKTASWLCFVTVIGTVHPHTRNRQYAHMLSMLGPPGGGLFLNIKCLLLLSNQDVLESSSCCCSCFMFHFFLFSFCFLFFFLFSLALFLFVCLFVCLLCSSVCLFVLFFLFTSNRCLCFKTLLVLDNEGKIYFDILMLYKKLT